MSEEGVEHQFAAGEMEDHMRPQPTVDSRMERDSVLPSFIIGANCCLEADTLEVAKILAEDTYLASNRTEELCNVLGLTDDFKNWIKKDVTPFASEIKLRYILNAWISQNPCEVSNITTLAERLKGMQLLAVSETLTSTFIPGTKILFKKRCRCAHSRQYQQPQLYVQNNQQVLEYHDQRQAYPQMQPLPGVYTDRPQQLEDEDELSEMLSNTSIQSRSSLASENIKIYLHNVPEKDQDEEVVDTILRAAQIREIRDFEVKRARVKSGWFPGFNPFAWGKPKNSGQPRPLKVCMKAKKNSGRGSKLTKRKVIERIQNTMVCKQFSVQVREEANLD